MLIMSVFSNEVNSKNEDSVWCELHKKNDIKAFRVHK